MENPQNNTREQQLYQFQYLKEQRDGMAQSLNLINGSLQNFMNTKATVENLKEVEDNSEILVPIGGSVIIKANIQETKKLLTYISQDVVIEKTLDESLVFIDKIMEEHNQQIKYLTEQIQKIDVTLQGMSQLLQQGYPQQ